MSREREEGKEKGGKKEDYQRAIIGVPSFPQNY